MFEETKERLNKLNFLGATSPIYYFSKISGLAPFVLEFEGNNFRFSRDIWSSLYTLIFYVIYLVCLCMFFNDTANSENYLKFPYVAKIGYWIHITSGFILSFVCLLCCFIKVERFSNFLNGVEEIDKKLNEINGHFKVELKKSFLFQVKTVTAVFGMLILASTYDYFVFYDLYGSLKIVVILTYLMPYIIAYSSSPGQFVSGVYMLYDRFRFINKLLNNIAGANQETSFIMKRINRSSVNESKPGHPATIRRQLETPTAPEIIPGSLIQEITPSPFDTEKNNSNMFDLIKNVVHWKKAARVPEENIYNLHLKMHELFALHDDLCLMSEKINEIYGFELVTSITCGFVMTLFAFFFEIKVIFWSGLTNHLLLFATSYIIWGILISMIVYQVLYMCSNTREECCESALIIHKLMVNKPTFMVTDEIYYTKMKSFTLEILHRKKNFHFNGLGMFNLDYTFIFSAVSAATSYLIVLLQLDLSDEFEKFSKVIQQ